MSPAAATSSLGSVAGVVVPTSPTGLRDALTAAAQAQLEAAQVQSLQVVGKMWSTLAGNGAAALDEVVLSDSGEECITPANVLHMPTCEVRALGTSGPGSFLSALSLTRARTGCTGGAPRRELREQRLAAQHARCVWLYLAITALPGGHCQNVSDTLWGGREL